MTMGMCKILLLLKFLVDADDWAFLGKTKLTFYIFCPSPCSKDVSEPLNAAQGDMETG